MCDIVYFAGLTEQTIPGDQVTALKFPLQMTYDWFPTTGILQMHMADPSSDFDVRANGFTYQAGSFNLLDFQQSTASIYGQTLTVTPSHTTYTAGDGLALYFGVFRILQRRQTLDSVEHCMAQPRSLKKCMTAVSHIVSQGLNSH